MKKKQITIRISDEQAEFLDAKIKDRTFANISHAIEVCVKSYMDQHKDGGE